jgi:hypothetical protein
MLKTIFSAPLIFALRNCLGFISVIGLLSMAPAFAQCPSYTTLQNNHPADAGQVMDNFEHILQCPNFTSVGIGTPSTSFGLVVDTAVGHATSQFGGDKAIFAINDPPAVGFNLYLDSVGWKFGEGSSNHFGDAIVATPTNGQMDFYTSNSGGAWGGAATVTSRMTLTQPGSLGLGTTNPTLGHLQIDGSGNQALAINSTNDDATIRLYYNNAMQWRIYNNQGAQGLMILDAAQTAGVGLWQGTSSWASVSDARLKDNVQSLSVLSRLANYRAVSFQWKASGKRDVGVIAQEIYPAFPEMVHKGNDGSLAGYRLDQPGIWSVDYSKLGAIALEGVKELDGRTNWIQASGPGARPGKAGLTFDAGTGNVGIGSAAAQKLDVAGTIRQSGCTTAGTLSTNASGDIICTSDARLKNVVGRYEGGLDALARVTPQRFTFKSTRADPVETFVHAGFIAQNVMLAIPEASARQRNGYYSLDTTAILAAAVNAIKQLKAENERQTALIAHQASDLRSLRAREVSEIRSLHLAVDALKRSRVQTAQN